MRSEEVIEALDRECARLLAAIATVHDAPLQTAVTGEGWAAKDVLAHLNHWATQIAFGLGADVERPLYMQEERRRREAAGDMRMPSGEESNALAVAATQTRSF